MASTHLKKSKMAISIAQILARLQTVDRILEIVTDLYIYVDRFASGSTTENGLITGVNYGTTASRWNHSSSSADSRGNGRRKCIVLLVIIVVAATTAGIGLFVVELKTPKLCIARAMVTSLGVGTEQNNQSLQATIISELEVKNPNLGGYDYGNTTLDFFYEGAMVGQASVPASGVARRSTKKMFLVAALDLRCAGAKLSTDLSVGLVEITSSAGMRGRVIGIFERSTSLNCLMQIMTATQSITSLVCE